MSANQKFSYKRLAYEFPFSVDSEDDFEKVKLLEYLGPENGDTVLFVLDYVPMEDIVSGQILSGPSKGFLLNLIEYSERFFKHKPFTWYATAYHTCRTIGTTAEFQARAFDAFHDRLLHIIDKIRPTKIVLFGKHQFEALCPDEYAKCGGKTHAYIGNPIQKTLKLPSKDKITVQITRLVSITGMLAGKEESCLSGYVARGLANALAGRNLFSISVPEFKIRLVDTIPKFEKLMNTLEQAPIVSIDTEDDNLNRIANRVLTLQFCVSQKIAYVLPYCHMDSPFNSKELKYIGQRLRDYFETNNNRYHIFVNAQFDLCTMRSQFGIRFYKAPIWDVQGAEYLLDENLVALSGLERTSRQKGSSYFGLLNLACQYGNFSYIEANFKKSDRENIKNLPLDNDLLEYCAKDVIIPFAIHEQQKRRAKVIGYTRFEESATGLLSDVIHAIHGLEFVGYKIDIAYLFRMKMPDSPINLAIKKAEHDLMNSEGATKANKLLIKKEGLPAQGLFDQNKNVLNLRKDSHLQTLFIKALKLEPLSIGAKGQALIDEKFQKKYSDVVEVKLFTDWKKAGKLKNAYVNQMLKFWGEQEDFKTDMRVRCRFDYTKVTGRLSASNPGLQQIPTHGSMAKYIKRMFIAEKGTVLVKVDFRVHEVRGWGIISRDKEVAQAFKLGQELIERYKLQPNAKLLESIETVGDIHKVNASFFFRKLISKVTKADRNNIKGVVFGLVYGMSDQSLSRRIGQSLEFTIDLVMAFMKKFPKGYGWFDYTEKHAQKHYFVESPLGRRRNLFGYMLPFQTKSGRKMHSRMNRLARNSPVQGMCSDFMMIGARNLQKALWQHYLDTGYEPKIKACISVHDSLECEVGYEDLLFAIKLIEDNLTTRVKEVVKERYNFEFVSDLMIDFEIGPSGSSLKKWNYEIESYSYKKWMTEVVKETGKERKRLRTINVMGLKDIVKMSLDFQQTELGYEQDKQSLYNSVFQSPTASLMPIWMKKQMQMAA